MRLNKYIAEHTSYSRRGADAAIEQGLVMVNGQIATTATSVEQSDKVMIDGRLIEPKADKKLIVLLNKPTGYVCSKDGQGSPTVYSLLPKEHQHLNIAGRLDKYSSGLVVLTNDGDLLYKLTHPSQEKAKLYLVTLNKPLAPADQKHIGLGVKLEDGPSKLKLTQMGKDGLKWQIEMHEGRNRQIRRTFTELGYVVKTLHRTNIGQYQIQDLQKGKFISNYI